MHTAKCLKSKKSYRIFHISKKQYFSMHFGFNNQFIKVKRTLAKISKTTKILFCLSFSIRGTILHVIRIPDIKSFSNVRTVRFYPIKIRTSLLRRAFLEIQTNMTNNQKTQKDLKFYQKTKQCSLPQVGRSWGANTFHLRNQSPYPISKTSQGFQ